MKIRETIKDAFAPVARVLDRLGGTLGLFVYSLGELRYMRGTDRRLIYETTVKQMYFTGVTAFPTITVIALAVGFIVNFALQTLGATAGSVVTPELISNIIITVVIRELGPLLTAIVLVARSGTAIAAEIGAMVVGHEYEAYESLGIDPMRFIVLPRVIALMLSMLILNICFSAIGVIGGLGVSAFISARIGDPIAFGSFLQIFARTFAPVDVVIILIKSMILGGLISVTSLYHGFKISGASHAAVAEAARRGVANAFTYIFIADGIITVLFYIAWLQ